MTQTWTGDPTVQQLARAVSDFLLDRSPRDVVAGVLLAMVVSGALTGLFALVRRRSSEPLVLLLGLGILANLVATLTGVGYVLHVRGEVNRPKFVTSAPMGWSAPGRPGPCAHWPPPPHWTHGFSAPVLVEKADADRDGRLSPEEAARFLRAADTAGKGSVDARDIEKALGGHATNHEHGRDADPGRASRTGHEG